MMCFLWIFLLIATLTLLSYKRASLPFWTLSILLYLLLVSYFSGLGWFSLLLIWIILLVPFLILMIRPLRRNWLTQHLLTFIRPQMPKLSATESTALKAGTVGWEGELFKGIPDWQQLLSKPIAVLSAEEQAFLDGPVEQLCEQIDQWKIVHELVDIPAELWKFIKAEGFFGMIIPKQYGGKGFSASAHSAVICKIASKSNAVATVVSVPNSLGPAELLLIFGTPQQKQHYLPKLASGEEIPCFALTSATAGSDASSIADYGVVCKATYNGKETLCMRLNWNKRYITLAPVATLIGLAFKLYDPNHLLGEKEKLGITCALIPASCPGISIGRRHYPLGSPFPNGPTQGKDVIVPLDFIIGGQAMVGKGWQMLMECLAAGRAITLPSLACGGAKLAVFATSAYARIRQQFGVALGKFGGVQEALTRIVGNTYIIDSARLMTVSDIDQGVKSAIAAAICKYNLTELGRQAANDAMDIFAGKGICLGPRNYIAQHYFEAPISITVEGANILTRSLMIFGQGALRCHPYLLTEIESAQNPDHKLGLIEFDKALFGHLGYMISNMVRSLLLGISSGHLAGAPKNPLKRYFQHFSRYSSAFAFLTDICISYFGGKLKRKERLSGRLGDILSMLYLGSSVLKHYANQDYPAQDLPLVEWSCQTLLYRIQQQIDGVIQNIPNRFLAFLLAAIIFPLGHTRKPASDSLSKQVAELFLFPSSSRQKLIAGAFLKAIANNQVGFIELALNNAISIEPLEHKLTQAIKKGEIKGYTFEEQINDAVRQKILATEEADALIAAQQLRQDIIAVDDFDLQDLQR